MNKEQERRTMAVLEEVFQERERQEQLLADGEHRFTCASRLASEGDKLAVLGEEFGEVSKEIYECERPHHRKRLRTELIQLSACCVAFAESLTDREGQ
jgi:hypothetical protein